MFFVSPDIERSEKTKTAETKVPCGVWRGRFLDAKSDIIYMMEAGGNNRGIKRHKKKKPRSVVSMYVTTNS